MVNIGTLSIKIDGDASSWIATVGLVNGSLANLAKSTQTKLQGIVKAFNGLSTGQKALTGVGIGVGLFATGLAAALGPAIRFESAWAGVLKTVEGSPAVLANIRSGLLDMSSVMPVAATDLADIAANAGQLGIEAGSVLKFTETVAKLGATTDLTFDAAAKSLARFINVTGAGQNDVARLADVLVHLGNNAATTESEILNFALRTAAASTIAGATEADILALSSSFSSMGIRAEAGGNSLGRVFTVLSDSAKSSNANLDTFARVAGVSADEMKRMIEANPTDALIDIGRGLGEIHAAGLPVQDVFAELGLGGIRTSEVLRQLALNSDEFVRQLNLARTAYSEGGQLNEEYARRLGTVASKLQIAKNAVTAFAIAAATPALAFFADALDFVGAAVGELTDSFGGAAGELGVLLIRIVQGFAQIGGAALLLVGGVDGAATVLRALGVTVETVASALNQVPAPILAAATAIAVLSQISAGAALKTFATNVITAATSMSTLRTGAQAAIGQFTGLAASITPAGFALGALVAVAAVWALSAAHVARETEKATGALRRMLDEGVSEQSAIRSASAIASMRDRISELQSTADQGHIEGYFATIQERGVRGFFSLANENKLATAEIQAFQEALGAEGVVNLERNLSDLSDQFGVSEAVIARVIDRTGAFNLATLNTGQAQRELASIVEEGLGRYDELEESLGRNVQAIDNSRTSLADYASALGVTEDALFSIDALVSDFSVFDVFSDDEEVAAEASAAFEAVRDRAFELATALNGGKAASDAQTSAMIAQTEATQGLLGAVDGLTAAITRANDAQAAAAYQAQLLADAQTAVGEATQALQLEPTTANAQALAAAYRDLNIAQVANADSVPAAKAGQAALAAEFMNLATSLGVSEEAAWELFQTEVLLNDQFISEINVEGLEVTEEVRAHNEEMDKAAREVLASIALQQVGVTPEELSATVANLQRINGTTATASVSVQGPWAATGQDELAIIQGQLRDIENQTATAKVDADATAAVAELLGLEATLDEVYGPREPIRIEADAGPADTVVRTIESQFVLLETRGTVVPIEASAIQALGEIERASSAAAAFTTADHTAQVGADITDALAKVGTAEADANDYASGDYTAEIKANIAAAQAAVQVIHNLALVFRNSDFTAQIRADASHAINAARVASAHATIFATTRYLAILRADASQALGAIGAANRALAGFQSKSITITSYARTVKTGANGMILDGAGVGTFAQGGIVDLNRGVRTRTGSAQIYSAAYPFRVVAEPETGGEAWIPMSLAKRSRAEEIWEEVGRRFGRFADGGIAAPVMASRGLGGTNINVRTTIPVTINATPGMDEALVASLVGDEIDAALGRVAADLDNAWVRS